MSKPLLSARGREQTQLYSCDSGCTGSPLQLSYFLTEVIQLFVAHQLSRSCGTGAFLRRDTFRQTSER